MVLATIPAGSIVVIGAIGLLVLIALRRVFLLLVVLAALAVAAVHFHAVSMPGFIQHPVTAAKQAVGTWQQQEISKLVCAHANTEEAEGKETHVDTADCAALAKTKESSVR